MIKQTFFENVCREEGLTNTSESLVKNYLVLKRSGLVLQLLRSRTVSLELNYPLESVTSANALEGHTPVLSVPLCRFSAIFK